MKYDIPTCSAYASSLVRDFMYVFACVLDHSLHLLWDPIVFCDQNEENNSSRAHCWLNKSKCVSNEEHQFYLSIGNKMSDIQYYIWNWIMAHAFLQKHKIKASRSLQQD